MSFLTSITICGAEDVSFFLDRSGSHYDLIISIDDPAQSDSGKVSYVPRLPDDYRARHLIVECPNDDSSPHANRSVIERLIETSVERVKSLIFDQTHPKNILIHCLGGIVRSPALAVVILYASNPTKSPDECVSELQRLCFEAAPHRGIIACGDRKFGAHGTLIEAVESNPAIRQRLTNRGARLKAPHL